MEYLFQTDDWVPSLADLLTELSLLGDDKERFSGRSASLDLFSYATPPVITVEHYLSRIYQYANCSKSCFLLGLIYIDRLIERVPGFFVTSRNVHRVMITSIMVAAKTYDDCPKRNSFYAHIGGISTQDIGQLEMLLLQSLDFHTFVRAEQFRKYAKRLQKTHYGATQRKRNSYPSDAEHVSLCAEDLTSGGIAKALLQTQRDNNKNHHADAEEPLSSA
eukprot:TRINITY_DN6271_c0_g1_i1.p1 TRINITY_DN6271_c0_g1~~TRINITY_DN6271_c0_g1_i1.p1  ORF type:complete len:219 (+),score=38.35 TRINITY_DN6271_c0_g1_i1:120-776(+)